MANQEITCVFCGLEFEQLDQVEDHIQLEHAGCQLPVFCNGKNVTREDSADEVNNNHISKETKFLKPKQQQQQQQQGGGSNYRSSVGRMSATTTVMVLGGGGCRQRCGQCQKQFVWKTALISHKQSQHGWHVCLDYSATGRVTSCKRGPLLVANPVYNKKRSHAIGTRNKRASRMTCNKCGYWFLNRHLLRLHEKKDCEDTSGSNNSNNWKLTCRKCDTVFVNSRFCLSHKQKAVCQRITDLPASRSSHVSSSEFSASFKENSVESRSNDGSVDKAGRVQKPANEAPLRLDKSMIADCPLTKKKGRYAGRHFKCEVCMKSFSNRSSLSNHIKSHNSRKGTPFVCRECGRRFVNLLTLQDHRRGQDCSASSTTVALSPDSTIPNSTTTSSEEVSVATAAAEIPASPKRDTSFSNFNGVSQVPLWPMSSGVSSAPTPQPVTCVHCGGTFYDRLELEEHALSQHSTEQGTILCLLCERVFTTNMALRVHLTKSHGFANGGCPGVSQSLPPLPKLTCGDFFQPGGTTAATATSTTNNSTSSTNPAAMAPLHVRYANHQGPLPSSRRRKRAPGEAEPAPIRCETCLRFFSTVQALANHRRACMPQSYKAAAATNHHHHHVVPPSSSHSIESLIADSTQSINQQRSSHSSSKKQRNSSSTANPPPVFAPVVPDDNNIFLTFNPSS